MSETLTVFFCGTGSTSKDAQKWETFHAGELVSTLYQNCQGLPYLGKVIFDGPGSGNLREGDKWIQSEMPNNFRGKAAGTGWENNVKAAVAVALAHVNIGGYLNRDGKMVNEEHLPYWIPDMLRQRCRGCNAGFNTISRKHHCRRCGEIFCSNCLKKEIKLRHVITPDYTVPNANAYIALKEGKAKVCENCEKMGEDQFIEQLAIKSGHIGDKQTAIQEIRNEIAEYRHAHPLTTINVIGWSRGGVTGIMFANACADTERLKGIKLNLFTLDPVPGYGSGGDAAHRCTLKANVHEYATVIQMDEVSRGFAAVLPHTYETTMCHYFTMPGRHATGVGNAALSGGKRGKAEGGKDWDELFKIEGTPLTLEEPGEVTRALVEKFLEHWGTNLDKKLKLDAKGRFKLYERMMRKEAQFNLQRNFSYTKLKQGGFFWPNCRDILVGGKYTPLDEIERLQSGFFINSDHAAIARAYYPGLENIYAMHVTGKKPKNIQDLMLLQKNLIRKLDSVTNFEKEAPVLYGCILQRAYKYWHSMIFGGR